MFVFFLQACFSFSEADALILLYELQHFTLLFALNAFSARHFEPAFVASAWCRSEKRSFFFQRTAEQNYIFDRHHTST